VPAGLLVLCLVAILILDLLVPASGQPDGGAGGGFPGYSDLKDPEPWVLPQFSNNGRFGLLMMKEQDPANPDKHKRLTADENGLTNNTCVRIDGHEPLFGLQPGTWEKGKRLVKDKDRFRWTSVMNFTQQDIRVTQVVEIVPNQQTRYLDTCLVRYIVENKSTVPHKVGLRVMLDTFIGANDGVPIRIPGEKDFLVTMKTFEQKEIPDYLQAWEKADLTDPGTIAHLGLKHFEIPGVELEPLESVVVCHWPMNSEVRWRWDPAPMNQPENKKDSCVVLYWAERMMAPDERRDMAFTYGLNTISSLNSGNAALSLTAGGSFRPGGTFTLTATVAKPEAQQKVTLEPLPKGVVLADKEVAEQVLAEGQAQVSWRLRGQEEGEHTLVVRYGRGSEKYHVKITKKSIFD
jgi:hypothetical protein